MRRVHPLPPLVIAALLTFAVASLAAAVQQAPAKGTLERITVHGRALEGNLEGDSPDRPVVVYLPPGYARDTNRRYPALYFLYGYTATAEGAVRGARAAVLLASSEHTMTPPRVEGRDGIVAGRGGRVPLDPAH